MSTLSVSTIQSSNSTSDLTIRASNTTGSQIVLFANGSINLQTLATVNTDSLAVATANVANLTITTLRIANGNPGAAGQVLQSNGTAVEWGNVNSPSFNTNISEQIGFLTTTDLTTAFTAPSTAGRRYIIHSIHATNISNLTTNLYIELEGTEYANTVIAGAIPVPIGASLEFLKRPKVLQPNDLIKIRSSANNSMHCIIVYQTMIDTNLFGDSFHIGAGNTTFDAFTASGNSVIESIQLTNYNSNTQALPLDAKVRTVWVNASNVVQGYFTYDLIVPSKSTVEALEAPKVLPVGHKIQVRSNITDYVDVVISGKLI